MWPNGEFVVFVGPSGCGKSTLLRLICGLDDVTDGTIAIDGEIVNDVPPARRGIAMVFQSYALYPHMSVAQNMGYSLRLAGTPKAEIARRVNAAAEILRLTPLLERKPRQLSAASASASPSGAPSCASRASSSSTSRSRISMRPSRRHAHRDRAPQRRASAPR
jgi:ABC-type sugar transport system ATPase subunit